MFPASHMFFFCREQVFGLTAADVLSNLSEHEQLQQVQHQPCQCLGWGSEGI